MKLNFFKRLAEKVRLPSKTEEKETVTAIAEQQTTTVETENVSGNCVKQAQNFLYNGNKPIGKPFGRRTEIRIVYVNNFTEAFLFFLRLCDQRLLDYRQTGDHVDCTAAFPNGEGTLAFTDKVNCRNKAVIAVLKIQITGLQPRLSEIRFEIKH